MGTQVPRSKRLLTDAGSNVLVFLTGHGTWAFLTPNSCSTTCLSLTLSPKPAGGEEFLKFQDAQELLSRDLADAVAQVWEFLIHWGLGFGI